MSDTTTDDKPGKKKAPEAAGNGVVTSHGIGEQEPIPKNVEFFDWLESLFDGSTQFPELIQWQVVEGKRFAPGQVINKIVYQPKSKKPSREELVRLSNKIIADLQYDCDVQRKETTYRVAALHFARDSDPYAVRKLRCSPRPLGSGHPEPRDSDDEENSQEKMFSAQLMRHHETMVPQAVEAYGGILQHMEAIMDRQYRRIAELEARCNQQADMIERLQSLREERERNRRWDEMKIASLEKARDTVLPMLPPMASQMMGKPATAMNGDTLEALTLRKFIESLKEEQAEMVLGKWENEKLVLQGVLAEAQAETFIRAAMCQIPIDRIDDLLPGGPLEITNEQMMAVMNCGIALPQLLPLRNLFEGRMKKKSAAATAAAK